LLALMTFYHFVRIMSFHLYQLRRIKNPFPSKVGV
jgi:hypothetical protein